MYLTQISELKNTLNINKNIYQSLNILQLSNLDLTNALSLEMEKNPFLEKDEVDNESDLSSSSLQYCVSRNKSVSFYDNLTDNSHTQSLEQSLEKQIVYFFKTKNDLDIARTLISYLDDSGYLNIDKDIFIKKHNITLTYLNKIIKILQKCEPIGIFAEDYIECFKIQLCEKNQYDAFYEKILSNLDMIAKLGSVKSAKILNFRLDILQNHLHIISTLNLKPSHSLNTDIAEYIIPDAEIYFDQAQNLVINIFKPSFFIKKTYYHQIKNNRFINKGDSEKIKNLYQQASVIVKAIEQRNSSLYKLLHVIIDMQKEFFYRGVGYLKPMSFKDTASILNMHESTISRIVNNKHIHTPYGVLSLKFFFTNAIAQKNFGKEIAISNRVIQNMIRKLIENETSNDVLSDEKICDILNSKNFNIARRTITKYRIKLGIASSQIRKRVKNKNNLKEVKYGY